MSAVESLPQAKNSSVAETTPRQVSFFETTEMISQLEELLSRVEEIIAPVWPLQDYVAINPYGGLADRQFAEARNYLQSFSKCETLMPLAYYSKLFQQGKIKAIHIEEAIKELHNSGSDHKVTVEDLISKLLDAGVAAEEVESTTAPSTIAEYVSLRSELDWNEVITNEISKHCSAHYDQGQSTWQSPWKEMSLFLAWRSAAEHDRNVEVLGLKDFRTFVESIPHTPDAAIVHCLEKMRVPEHLWEGVLLRMAYSIPGWCAWAKYQDQSQSNQTSGDLHGVLAIRLAFEAALGEAFSLQFDWQTNVDREPAERQLTDERLVLLRASELAFRGKLVDGLLDGGIESKRVKQSRKLAQLVFCIDVRSERIRRHLEAQSAAIETFGFAGFFAMPIEFVPLGAESGSANVPVLLQPQFRLREGLDSVDPALEAEVIAKRQEIRSFRKLWKSFQSSAVSCFSFVETAGLLFAGKLFKGALGWKQSRSDAKFDGIDSDQQYHLAPTLRDLNHQGITTSKQVDLAHGMLKNLGLEKNFARLVAFCGHACQTENNPLAAGLDCGACGGHSGEPNARMAALLLNQPYIRQELAKRGVEIPSDTWFLGGLHNTTTDAISYFDLDQLPETHQIDYEELVRYSEAATHATRIERLPIVDSQSLAGLAKRATDWSEVRPEWGLAGNAAFIIAPRSHTKNLDLDGRSFLHSYDHQDDPNGEVLENIMTAPMIVAHLINMQYYASTVDQKHFGSGTKTIHNVVGKFGILSGNSGDLMTGLPWQSLHSGENYQHEPMRLQAVIAAPLESIDRIINKQSSLAALLENQWLHLIAIDDEGIHRYLPSGDWQLLKEGTRSLEGDSSRNAGKQTSEELALN
ncbi:MAG: DUF2309 domain-containing protein [Lacipirellulaceae bacterium]